jgi:hypothetical protein
MIKDACIDAFTDPEIHLGFNDSFLRDKTLKHRFMLFDQFCERASEFFRLRIEIFVDLHGE